MEFTSRGASEQRHRLIILTDMENEPDDSQTMVKLLMYSNEIDIEGLIAVSSRWLQDTNFPESIVDRIHADGVVRPNLQRHAAGWPVPDDRLGFHRGLRVDLPNEHEPAYVLTTRRARCASDDVR